MSIIKQLSKSIYVLLTVLLITALSVSCIRIVRQNGEGASTQQMTEPSQLLTPGQSNGKTRPHPPVRTGEITLGQKMDMASQSIGTDGGGIVVSKPGDPLDGFSVGVPPGAYSNSLTFKVSYAPVTKQTFGFDFIPASPLITIDNGGGYSEQLMYIKVPVKIPKNYFAMGFLYDEKTKQVEGMPLIAQDDTSITVATRHFSSFIIAMVNSIMLKADVDSKFRPGIDDWQFKNRGSFIAPGGHCEGQSLSAMWYYCTQPDGKDLCLYGRYDNNGNKPETPNLWEDDSLGYRFCSVVHKDVNVEGFAYDFWRNIAGRSWQKINNKWQWADVPELISDSTIRNLFAYSIQMTEEPQEIGIQSNAGGGHAMICYRVSKGTLYIADPNYPGNTDRNIELIDDKFKPYNSGANTEEIEAGKGKNFEHIYYQGKSTVVSWDKIAQHWTEFKNGTIGHDKFPQLDLRINVDGKITSLTDGFISTKPDPYIFIKNPFAQSLSFKNYMDENPVPTIGCSINPLKLGNNKVGFCIQGEKNGKLGYIDFKYLNIIYKAEEPPPPTARVKVTAIITQASPECSVGLINIYDDTGKKMIIGPVDLKPGSWKYAAELLPGSYIVKYSCRCSPKGQKDYTPEKEFPITVSKDPITLNLPCPP
jgi:hypothetical protein